MIEGQARIVALLAFAFAMSSVGLAFLWGPDRVADAIYMTAAGVNLTLAQQAAGLRGDVTLLAFQLEQDADRRIGEAESRTDRLLTTSALAAVHELEQSRELATATIERADYRTGQIIEILGSSERDVNNASLAFGNLADRYALIPDQLAGSPAWRSLQPEITCRLADGSGYGGCWHSRITGLMGEAVSMGGVFTQHFPALADSVTGIAGTADLVGKKFTAPQTVKGRIWEGLKLGLYGASRLVP